MYNQKSKNYEKIIRFTETKKNSEENAKRENFSVFRLGDEKDPAQQS
jgi:hypothetical protein